MRIEQKIQSAYLVQGLQANMDGDSICRLNFRFNEGDILCCICSGFAPWPALSSLLNNLSEQQTERLFSGNASVFLSLPEGKYQLQCFTNKRASTCIQNNGLPVTLPSSLTLPLKVQLWIYHNNTIYENAADSRCVIPLKVEYSISNPLLGGQKVTITVMGPSDQLKNGSLCYVVNSREYPIPNQLLGQAFPLKLEREPQIQAASPWRDLFKIHRKEN